MNSKDVFDKILRFCDGCGEIYLYGKGNIGKAALAFLEDNALCVKGFIVTTKRVGADEIRDRSGRLIPVYEKEEFLHGNRSRASKIIFSLSEKFQKQVTPKDFQPWKTLWLRDYQLNEISRYKFIKETGKYRQISPLRTSFENWREKTAEKASRHKYDSFGRQIDPWHMIPKFKKPYVKDIISTVNKLPLDTTGSIVECGCGLCDIVGSKKLKRYQRFGFDVDENVIYVDEKLYPNIAFTVGSFEKIHHMNISVLIAVNFLHLIPEDVLRMTFHKLFAENNVHYFIVDESTGLYKYTHKFMSLLPAGCTLVKTLGPYEGWCGVRYIKIFEMFGLKET